MLVLGVWVHCQTDYVCLITNQVLSWTPYSPTTRHCSDSTPVANVYEGVCLCVLIPMPFHVPESLHTHTHTHTLQRTTTYA